MKNYEAQGSIAKNNMELHFRTHILGFLLVLNDGMIWYHWKPDALDFLFLPLIHVRVLAILDTQSQLKCYGTASSLKCYKMMVTIVTAPVWSSKATLWEWYLTVLTVHGPWARLWQIVGGFEMTFADFHSIVKCALTMTDDAGVRYKNTGLKSGTFYLL